MTNEEIVTQLRLIKRNTQSFIADDRGNILHDYIMAIDAAIAIIDKAKAKLPDFDKMNYEQKLKEIISLFIAAAESICEESGDNEFNINYDNGEGKKVITCKIEEDTEDEAYRDEDDKNDN